MAVLVYHCCIRSNRLDHSLNFKKLTAFALDLSRPDYTEEAHQGEYQDDYHNDYLDEGYEEEFPEEGHGYASWRANFRF